MSNEGNPQIEEGFTKIANELLEALSRAMATGLITARERAVLDYIMRYTYGFQKIDSSFHTKTIADSLSLSMSWVSQILKSLQSKKIIIREQNIIKLNKYYLEWSKHLEQSKHLEPSKQNSKEYSNKQGFSEQSLEQSKQSKSLEQSKVSLEPSKQSLEQSKLLPSKKVPTNAEQNNVSKGSQKIPKEIIIKKEYKYINNTDAANNTSLEQSKLLQKKKSKITFNAVNGTLEGIPQEFKDKLAAAFPKVDIAAEIKKAEAWLYANPAKRKKDYRRFLFAWMNRAEQERQKATPKINKHYVAKTYDGPEEVKIFND